MVEICYSRHTMNEDKVKMVVFDLQGLVLRIQAGLQELNRELYREVDPRQTPPHYDSLAEMVLGPEQLTLYQLHQGDYRFTKPVKLAIGDMPAEPVRYWKEVVVSIAEWFMDHSRFSPDTANPVIARDRGDFTDHGGNPDSYLVKSHGLWIDTWGNVNAKVVKLIALCDAFDVDPSAFRIGVLRRARI